jgi:hypothetical protein
LGHWRVQIGCRCHAHANSHGYAHSYPAAHLYAYCNPDTYPDANGNSHNYSFSHGNPDAVSYIDANSYAYANSYADCDCDCLTNPNTNPNAHPNAYLNKFLCRSGLDRHAQRHGEPTLGVAWQFRMDCGRFRAGKRRRHNLFLGVESRWRDAAIRGLVCAVQANRLRVEPTYAGWIQLLQRQRNVSELAG